MAAAAVCDVLFRRIPNLLVVAVAGLYVVDVVVARGASWHPGDLVVAGGVLGLGFAAFAAGALGGGDAKLLAALSLWMGWPAVVPFTLITAVLGGAIALGIVVWRALGAVGVTAAQRHPVTTVPYGVAVAGAAVLVLEWPDVVSVMG